MTYTHTKRSRRDIRIYMKHTMRWFHLDVFTIARHSNGNDNMRLLGSLICISLPGTRVLKTPLCSGVEISALQSIRLPAQQVEVMSHYIHTFEFAQNSNVYTHTDIPLTRLEGSHAKRVIVKSSHCIRKT